MKFTFKIWVLIIALGLSLISIVALPASYKFIIFLLILASFLSLSFVKSKLGRVIFFLIPFILIGLIIMNSFQEGVLIKSVEADSIAFNEGLRQGMVIKSVDGNKIVSMEDYGKIINEIFNKSSGEKIKLSIETNEGEFILYTNSTPQITVAPISLSNVQTGLDLRGGARALVQPEGDLTDEDMQDLVAISQNRFNVYGLSDVNIKSVSDLDGNKYLLIEVAGATPDDLEQLISQQGEFEAKIANQTVFRGGEKDIADVCRNDASCAYVNNPTRTSDGSYVSNFAFTVYLREEAAQRHADITSNLSLDNSGRYLSEKLYLYIDGKEVDSLLISSSLRGQATTQIMIQGSGTGSSREAAIKAARAQMNKLQTILLTGSLPYKLDIVKLDTISPTLGRDFTRAILLAMVVSIILVSLLVFGRYRKIKASAALLLTSFSELIIILGVASMIRWNLDLPSIAGILATIGTGVDQQIIIIDEAGRSRILSIKEKIKQATSIILSAYLTLVAAMVPLYWAGAGLFKGFALTSIIGVTAGVLITRPAFAEIIKKINK